MGRALANLVVVAAAVGACAHVSRAPGPFMNYHLQPVASDPNSTCSLVFTLGDFKYNVTGLQLPTGGRHGHAADSVVPTIRVHPFAIFVCERALLAAHSSGPVFRPQVATLRTTPLTTSTTA